MSTPEATTPGQPPAGDGRPAITPTLVLRPLGSSLPLGLAGLALASWVLTGLELRWLAPAQGHFAGIAIMVAAVPLQAIACVLAFPSRDGATASAMGALAVSWLALGIVHVLLPPGGRSPALGMLLLGSGVLLLGSLGALGASKPLPAFVIGLAGTRFALSGIYEVWGAAGWRDAGGWVGLAVAVAAAYTVWALQMEDTEDSPVLPTFRRGPGEKALTAPAAGQLAGVEHEAGVRRQL